jgi:predicted ester cyclase
MTITRRGVAFGVISTGVLGGCGSLPIADRANASADQRAGMRPNYDSLIDQYFAACNENQLQRLDAIFDPGMTLHRITGQTIAGREVFKTVIQSFHRAFPDLKWSALERIYAPNRAVVRYRFEGTHLGEFRGIQPSGRRVSFSACEVIALSDNGLVMDIWNYSDPGFLRAG